MSQVCGKSIHCMLVPRYFPQFVLLQFYCNVFILDISRRKYIFYNPQPKMFSTMEHGGGAQTIRQSRKGGRNRESFHKLNTNKQTTMKKNFLEHFRYSIYHSNHHTAEMWDLEFGSNTTEKFQNSPKFFQIFQRVLKFFRGVIKPNSKSNLSAA